MSFGPQHGALVFHGCLICFGAKRFRLRRNFPNSTCHLCLLRSMMSQDWHQTYGSGAHPTEPQLTTLALVLSAIGAILDVRERDGMFPENGEKVFRRWRHGSVRNVRLQQGNQSDHRLGRFQRFRCVATFLVDAHDHMMTPKDPIFAP